MNIIRRPFQDFDDFFSEDDNWFFPVFSRKMSEPEMDVYETEKDVVAKINIPDFNQEDIKISIEDDVLKVSGEVEEEREEGEEGRSYWKKEIRKSSFSRSVRLPADVDEEKTEASYKNGLLEVVMPKKEPEKRKEKEIKIKSK
jgi:HSP20 family protein